MEVETASLPDSPLPDAHLQGDRAPSDVHASLTDAEVTPENREVGEEDDDVTAKAANGSPGIVVYSSGGGELLSAVHRVESTAPPALLTSGEKFAVQLSAETVVPPVELKAHRTSSRSSSTKSRSSVT